MRRSRSRRRRRLVRVPAVGAGIRPAAFPMPCHRRPERYLRTGFHRPCPRRLRRRPTLCLRMRCRPTRFPLTPYRRPLNPQAPFRPILSRQTPPLRTRFLRIRFLPTRCRQTRSPPAFRPVKRGAFPKAKRCTLGDAPPQPSGRLAIGSFRLSEMGRMGLR